MNMGELHSKGRDITAVLWICIAWNRDRNRYTYRNILSYLLHGRMYWEAGCKYIMRTESFGKPEKIFSDDSHIIYVNAAIQDDTRLGRLMHDLFCKHADDMYSEVLANG